jgi:hypothetical protein
VKNGHESRFVAGLLGSCLIGVAASPALALQPTQVFDKVSGSVWVVRALDASERPFAQGSAVVIAPGKLVTNCHVLAKAVTVQVRRENVTFDAKLEHADTGRDLCILQVARFDAPAVQVAQMGALRVGQRVYAIGTPRGLEATLSEGLISGLRTVFENPRLEKVSSEVIQTTAPISPGSSGGGLFDEEGRLVGITSFVELNAQNINYALPADWISAVPERAQAALARRSAARTAAAAPGASPVPPGYPAPGTAWVYGYTERIFGRTKIDVTVRVLRVDEGTVEETVSANAPGAADVRRLVNTRAARFLEYPLSTTSVLLELAPYLLASSDDKAPTEVQGLAGYPIGVGGLTGWEAAGKVGDWEEIKVPAGSFRALRVEVSGRRIRGVSTRTPEAGRFKMTVWYAPDVKRIVRLEHRTWAADPSSPRQTVEDVVELLSYRPPS